MLCFSDKSWKSGIVGTMVDEVAGGRRQEARERRMTGASCYVGLPGLVDGVVGISASLNREVEIYRRPVPDGESSIKQATM